jgi:hypothetical protein
MAPCETIRHKPRSQTMQLERPQVIAASIRNCHAWRHDSQNTAKCGGTHGRWNPPREKFDRVRNLSELLSAKGIEFRAAGVTEFAKQIDGPAIEHLPQFEEAFVRGQIGIDNLSSDTVGTFDDF